MIEVRTKMQKPQLRWPANAIQCLIETIAEVKLAERCWQKNVLQGPIECHAKGQSLQTPRPADVAATDHSTNFPCPSAAIYRRQTDFLQGHLQRSPRCKCVRPSGKLAAPGVSENKLLARRCRKLTGQRQNGKRQPPPVKLLPKQSCSNRGGSRTLSMHWLKEAPKISACKVSGSCASASG